MQRPNWYVVTLCVLAIIGFIDATSLTIEHYSTLILPCTITSGCEIVTNSAYSSILGIPVALLGALYYIAILLGVYASFEFAKPKILQLIAKVSVIGFLFSAWFVYVQLFILHAICQYCMISAATSTIIFIASLVYLRRLKISSPSPSPDATPEE